MIEALILKYGYRKLAIVAFVLFIALFYGGALGWAKLRAWYYEGKVERVTEQRDQARAEAKVARQDEAQAARSADITADTTAKQDAHAAEQRKNTAAAVGEIHERIREVPVVVPIADDPIVRQRAIEAVRRAQGAADRLQRAPGA